MSARTSICLLLLTALTSAYCIAIWYASHLWSALILTPELSRLPLAWLGIAPLPSDNIWLAALHWQSIALFSLVFVIYRSVTSRGETSSEEACTRPAVLHLSWLLFALMLHAIGALSPMLSIGYSIG